MSMPENEIVVLDIAGNQAVLHSSAPEKESGLFALGFLREGDRFVRAIIDDTDQHSLVLSLIQIDAVFSDGPGWSPAEVVEFCCEQGLKVKSYRVISWRSPSKYVISSKSGERKAS